MRATLIGIVGLLVTGIVLLAQAPDPAKVAAGQKAYATVKCDTCHAIAGVGGKLSEADIRKWQTTPAAMEVKLPKKPAMPMSTYLKSHKLADADIDALTAYMMSLK